MSGKRCDSYIPPLMFDMLLSAPLISSNNSHLGALLPLLHEMIYEALNSRLQGPLLESQVMRYSSFILIPSLTSPSPSCYTSSLFSTTSFFNLSRPISSPYRSGLSHFVSMYHSIAQPLPFFSLSPPHSPSPFDIWTIVTLFPSPASVSTSSPDFIPPSPSLPPFILPQCW